MVPAPVIAALRRKGPGLVRRKRSACRALFIARVQSLAAVHQAEVRLEVADDVDIAPGVQLEIWPHSRSTVCLLSGASLRAGALVSLRGGRLEVGRQTQIRRGATLHVQGSLTIGDGVTLSTGTVVHCHESVSIADLTIIGEYSSIVDSRHLRTPPGVPIHHHVRSSPVSIGGNCWLGAGCLVADGVTIGDQAVIAGHAVVTKDIPPGWFARGAPARPVREVLPSVQ